MTKLREVFEFLVAAFWGAAVIFAFLALVGSLAKAATPRPGPATESVCELRVTSWEYAPKYLEQPAPDAKACRQHVVEFISAMKAMGHSAPVPFWALAQWRWRELLPVEARP